MPRPNFGWFRGESEKDLEYSKVYDGFSDTPELRQALPYRFWSQKTGCMKSLLFVITWLLTAAVFGFGMLSLSNRGQKAATHDFFPHSTPVTSRSSNLSI